MFKFLKDKLKSAVSKFTKDIEEEVEEKAEIKKDKVKADKIKIKKEEEKRDDSKKKLKDKILVKKKHPKSKIKKSEKESEIVRDKEQIQTKAEEAKTKEEETKEEVKDENKNNGFFSKIKEAVTKKTLSIKKFEELFFELEIILLENNVAYEVIEKIKDDLKDNLLSKKISRIKTSEIIEKSLKNTIEELFNIDNIDIFESVKKKKPYVICFIGVNGSGKTTNLAKVAHMFKEKGLNVVIAACDTFRAAAIQQIENHSKNLEIKLIKHDYGADAAAVAFDAIEHAKSKGKDVVLIDTAGRSHANTNLMEELEKVIRISKPDLKIFVGDSLTGNDVVEQAKTFNSKVGIDAIILTKADVDEKGGAAISISYVTKKPIIFLGTGQKYLDIEPFSKQKIFDSLGF